MDQLILTENRGAVRVLTMNRPDKLNALNGELIHALTGALSAAQEEDGVAVVILAGAGRAFCAGADISVARPLTAETRRGNLRHGDRMIALLKLMGRIDKPIIAAVHGYALGAGFGLAIGSDLVVAGESARFGYPELKRGLAATTVTAHAVHLMGRKIAFELLTVCENIEPRRAQELGMVNRVVADAALMDTAMGLAETLTGWNHEALWQTKRVFQRAAMMHPEASLEMARDTAVLMGRLTQ